MLMLISGAGYSTEVKRLEDIIGIIKRKNSFLGAKLYEQEEIN